MSAIVNDEDGYWLCPNCGSKEEPNDISRCANCGGWPGWVDANSERDLRQQLAEARARIAELEDNMSHARHFRFGRYDVTMTSRGTWEVDDGQFYSQECFDRTSRAEAIALAKRLSAGEPAREDGEQ